MTFLYIIGAILVVVIILSLIAPKSYDVSRSIVINKPKAEVFSFLLSLKKMDLWSPWAKKDPNMVKTYTGDDEKVGFISHWVGNKEVGEGEQEIIKIEPDRISSELRFIKPFKSTSDAYLVVEEIDADSTKVIWGFSGKNVFPMSIVALFMSMDKMVGKDFEAGLASLKAVLEEN